MARLTCALGPDSAGTLLHRFLAEARERLDLALYEVGPSYGWTLPEAVRRGARVRARLDGHGGGNRGCLDELARAAEHGVVVPCRIVRHRLGGEAHWKLICADNDRLALGTGNLIGRDAPADGGGLLPPACAPLTGTREWWAFVAGVPSLAAVARAGITAAWRRAAPPPRLWAVEEDEAHVPPLGAPIPAVAPLEIELAPRRLQLAMEAHAVRELLLAELAAPQSRALVVAPYVHTWARPVRPLLDRLGELAGQGLDVRVLLGRHPSGGDAATLRDRGISARVMDPARSTTGHAKGMVVNGTVVISSANWSEAGLGSSLEAALRVDHPAAAGYYADAFERDWATANPTAA